MKKLDIFVLFLIAAMMVPATVWAKKVKYGKGVVLEGTFPGEATLTCGKTLTFTGNFEEAGSGYILGSDEYNRLKSTLVGKYGIPTMALAPSKTYKSNYNSISYGHFFQVDVKNCRLTAMTDEGQTITYDGDALWGQFGNLYYIILCQGALKHNNRDVKVPSTDPVSILVDPAGLFRIVKMHYSYILRKDPCPYSSLNIPQDNPHVITDLQGSKPKTATKQCIHVYDIIKGEADYDLSVDVVFDKGEKVSYTMQDSHVTSLDGILWPNGDHYYPGDGLFQRNLSDGIVSFDDEHYSLPINTIYGDQEDAINGFSHICIEYKDKSKFDGSIWDEKKNKVLQTKTIVKSLIHANSIKELNFKLHGILKMPDGKNVTYYQGSLLSDLLKERNAKIASKNAAEQKAESVIKARCKTLRGQYVAKYGANSVSAVVGNAELFFPEVVKFKIPNGLPFAFIDELIKDVAETNRIIENTPNCKCIKYNFWKKEYVPSLAVQGRFGRGVRVFEVTLGYKYAQKYTVYVVNGKVVATNNLTPI